MNGKVAIAVSIFAAVLVLVPGVGFAKPIQNQGQQYSFGNEKIIFNGKNVQISFGSRMYRITWKIYEVNGSDLNLIHFKNYSYKRIYNINQNTGALLENNTKLKVAQVYAFGPSIDASIAIKNLEMKNVTYEVMFEIQTGSHKNVVINGFNPQSKSYAVNNQFAGVAFLQIPSTDWSVSMGRISINWLNELALFQGGAIAASSSYNRVGLPFGPITLHANETYNVDPSITDSTTIPSGSGGSGFKLSGSVTNGLSYGGSIYDSSSNKLGDVSETFQTPNTEYEAGVQFGTYMVFTFRPSSSEYNVNYVSQQVVQLNGVSGNLIGGMHTNYFQDCVSNSNNNGVMSFVISAMTSFLGDILRVGIPNPSSLFADISYTTNGELSNNNGYYVTENAGDTVSKAGVYYNSLSYGYWTYAYGFIPVYNTKNVHEFGDYLNIRFQQDEGGSISVPYYNNIEYTSTFQIVDSNIEKLSEFPNGQYSMSMSETFQLSQYEL